MVFRAAWNDPCRWLSATPGTLQVPSEGSSDGFCVPGTAPGAGPNKVHVLMELTFHREAGNKQIQGQTKVATDLNERPQ